MIYKDLFIQGNRLSRENSLKPTKLIDLKNCEQARWCIFITWVRKGCLLFVLYLKIELYYWCKYSASRKRINSTRATLRRGIWRFLLVKSGYVFCRTLSRLPMSKLKICLNHLVDLVNVVLLAVYIFVYLNLVVKLRFDRLSSQELKNHLIFALVSITCVGLLYLTYRIIIKILSRTEVEHTVIFKILSPIILIVFLFVVMISDLYVEESFIGNYSFKNYFVLLGHFLFRIFFLFRFLKLWNNWI